MYIFGRTLETSIVLNIGFSNVWAEDLARYDNNDNEIVTKKMFSTFCSRSLERVAVYCNQSYNTIWNDRTIKILQCAFKSTFVDAKCTDLHQQAWKIEIKSMQILLSKYF